MNLTCFVITVLLIWDCLLLYCVECIQKRILDGETDWLNLYNYQVSIQVKKWKTGRFEHGCGGSIINGKNILTAAHCFLSRNGTVLDITNDRVRILAGTNQIDSGGIYANIDKVFLHKNFKHIDHVSIGDIAVIKLRDKLDVRGDPRLAVIQTPKKLSYDAYVNKTATVSGFGVWKFIPDTDEQGKPTAKPILSNNRQYLAVKILSKDKCSTYDNVICSTVLEHHFVDSGVCEGDSGGPLVSGGTVIGIVSTAAKNCDMRKKTAKYTRVASYLDFIRRAVKNDSDKSDMTILSNT